MVSTTREVSDCYDDVRTVESGFKAPRQCNCAKKECGIKAKDPVCLTQQLSCQTQRNTYLKTRKDIPANFTSMYAQIQSLKDMVAGSAIKTRLSRKAIDLYQGKFDRAMNTLKVLEVDKKYAEKALVDAEKFLEKEISVLRAYNTSKQLENHFVMSSVHFKHTLPLVDNINLNIAIKHKTSTEIVYFVWNLNENTDTLLKTAARKTLYSALPAAGAYTYAKSSTVGGQELGFKPWGKPVDAQTIAQIACTTKTRALKYLKDLLENLKRKGSETYALKKDIEDCEKKLKADSYYLLHKENSAGSLVIEANHDAIESGKHEMKSLGSQTSVGHVLAGWLSESELMTGLLKLNVCFNSKDCVKEALESLRNLPPMVKVSKGVYTRKIFELAQQFFFIHKVGLTFSILFLQIFIF